MNAPLKITPHPNPLPQGGRRRNSIDPAQTLHLSPSPLEGEGRDGGASRLFRPLAVLAFLFLAVSADAKGRRPPELSFALDPVAVTAGRTLRVDLRSSAPLKNPALYYKDRKSFFYATGPRAWTALVGVNSLEEPGEKSAAFYAEWAGGRVHQATVTFQVVPGTYPVSRVTLSADRDKLVASGQMERDAKVLEKHYQPAPDSPRLWSGYFIMPTTGVVSSLFGARRSYGQRSTLTAHSGLDLANDAGTLIVAPNAGRVVYADRLESFGHSVVLDHGWGVFSYYLHMTERAVEPGALVKAGDKLGLMGAEGVATGPHLHWSFVVSGERVDPREWTEREFR